MMNSLGFDKAPKDTRVVVAMSGGVDSSVAAALLHEQGYQVIGITLQLYDHGEALQKKGACCAGQDICFVPGGSYAKVVEKFRPGALSAGDIVHIDGRTLGQHSGIINYTVGQRRGIGIGGGYTENNSPLFVVGLRPDKNQVVVGPYEALARDTVYMKESNWLMDVPEGGLAVDVKLRSAQPPLPATLFKVRVVLQQPAFGVAAGQACVCYVGSRVIGGGWITGAENQKIALVA